MNKQAFIVDGALLDEEAAAKYLGMTRRFMQARRQRGGSPPYVRISARAIRYRKMDLDRWIQERICTSTSDASAREND